MRAPHHRTFTARTPGQSTAHTTARTAHTRAPHATPLSKRGWRVLNAHQNPNPRQRIPMTARRAVVAALALTALAIAANAALTHTIDRLATDLLAPPHEETIR